MSNEGVVPGEPQPQPQTMQNLKSGKVTDAVVNKKSRYVQAALQRLKKQPGE